MPVRRRADLYVVLPRFSVESTHQLVEPLQALGVRRAFTPASDFTPMSPVNPWLARWPRKRW